MKHHALLYAMVAAAAIPFSAKIGAAQVVEPSAAVSNREYDHRIASLPTVKLSKEILAADADKKLSVIVQFKNDDTSEHERVVQGVNGTFQRHLTSIRAVSAEMSGSAAQALGNDPRVAYVSPDRPVSSRGANIVSVSTSAEYTVEPINAPAVWQRGYNGTGIGVALVDSGVQSEPDLSTQAGSSQRIVYNASFPANLAGGTGDPFGHGTHVAGLIAGNGDKSTGPQFTRTFSGVAPNANIINLRALDQNGQGSDSTVIAGIEAAIALKSTYNIRVINLSLGRPIWESYKQDPLCQAAEAAWQAGIVVVVAAGNSGRDKNLNPEGYGTIEAPGNDPYVLTVGAMNTMNTALLNDDVLASYSSKGPSFIDDVAKPDIVAPGNLVTSLLVTGSTLTTQNPSFYTPRFFYMYGTNPNPSADYMPLSGTSMATGVVSGAVALLLQAQPQLTPDQVKALIMYSAQRSYFPLVSLVIDALTGAQYTSHYNPLTIGAGYLDIQATLNNALIMASSLPSGTAMSPIVNVNPATSSVTLVTDQTALWGRGALWGASNVYGQNAFQGVASGATALWGATALSGSDDPTGFTALWGATALWGRGTADAATALWGASTLAGSSTISNAAMTDAN